MSTSPAPNSSPAVVTRFAPSPTGYLHIGGARTALFNWLYAKARGGKFLLRIEDTDRERSTEAAVQAIFDGLNWLGLEADETPIFQFSRVERHREVVEELLQRGGAYRDWMTPEELQAERDAAKAEGRRFRSPWRDRGPDEAMPNRPYAVRFKGPLDGETLVDDLVQGEVRWKNKDLDDLVIARSDGTPTYNFAVVVDDHDMGVTHVIRGDDHLNNAARQSLIYEALGWAKPRFAHIPLIHGPDGAKLSKRHGAQAVGDYAAMGYLPEAMRNYLARLGWAHGDDEIFSDEQAIAWFDIADVGRAPARLDFDKLAHVNGHWMRLADDARLAELTVQALERKGAVADRAETLDRLTRAMPVLKDRAKTLVELADPAAAFVLKQRPLVLDDKTLAALDAETRARLQRLLERLRLFKSWDVFALETELKAFAGDEGVGMGKIGPGLRGVLAGGSPAPDLAKTLAALGRDESLGRLADALSSDA
jgi:glutamyl-tRNA synthetase